MQDAIAPEVISASRSTDIPAFHADWFMNRLRAGYVKWVNPFNQRAQYVSFENTKAIVFWSKNPKPMVRYLPEIDERRIAYYFQYTLNDYESEGFEPNVPAIADRIALFRSLSEFLGPERVVWRFDPLILSNLTSIETLLHRLRSLGEVLHPCTRRLIFSFADIENYRKVQRNLSKSGVVYREFTCEECQIIGSEIGELCRGWGIGAFTCGESVDLSRYGILKGKCIDDQLLLHITDHDPAITDLFGTSASQQLGLFGVSKASSSKDPGQRAECGCVFSKDIGQYNTCPHLCVYCYANTSPGLVQRNCAMCRIDSESILG